MGIGINDLPPHMREQARKQLSKAVASGGAPRSHGVPESTAHHALPQGPCPAEISTPVYLVVLLYRTAGLHWDLDNASIKPFLDGIVQSGLLEDDSTAQIQGLIHLPFKVKTKAEEKTELEFWDAEHFAKYITAARQG